MNRHKANWSQMHDESQEESVQSIQYKEMRQQLRSMVDRFGFDEIVKELRLIYEGGD